MATKSKDLFDKLIDIEKTLVRNTASLEEHMRRTALLEDMSNDIREELEPIKRHINSVSSIVKFLSISAAVFSSTIAIYHLFF